ncbi:MAG: hypothetical protein A3H43_03580 [Gammaproteobacteria bacterium RIFCSPLOWO2_02_FULL_42_9]|nr:MAG: hypothetical protein A3H43_03580 [Gammaproteobacteria bacterium RIFCSPLOWO2_02_FULL_42_9]
MFASGRLFIAMVEGWESKNPRRVELSDVTHMVGTGAAEAAADRAEMPRPRVEVLARASAGERARPAAVLAVAETARLQTLALAEAKASAQAEQREALSKLETKLVDALAEYQKYVKQVNRKDYVRFEAIRCHDDWTRWEREGHAQYSYEFKYTPHVFEVLSDNFKEDARARSKYLGEGTSGHAVHQAAVSSVTAYRDCLMRGGLYEVLLGEMRAKTAKSHEDALCRAREAAVEDAARSERLGGAGAAAMRGMLRM